MPLQSSGQISFGDLNVELGLSRTTQISLGQSSVRTLAGIGSGAIRLGADNYNKFRVVPGSISYTVPGTYTFVVPNYFNLNVTVNGAGGGGGGGCGGQLLTFLGCVNFCFSSNGNAGGQSSFNNVISYGGAGGIQCNGGVGAAGGNNQNGSLGGGGSGGAGGVSLDSNCNQSNGSPGGAGGSVAKIWTTNSSGAPSFGQIISITVGGGGTGVADGCRPAPGQKGTDGSVIITWN